MHIKQIYIFGFKCLSELTITFDPKFNVIVGDNETGKSSILEALALVLSRQYDGRTIDYSIDPYLFNLATVSNYFTKVRGGEFACPPKILIEAYFDSPPTEPEAAKLQGKNNTFGIDCPGLSLSIEVDNEHTEALKEYVLDDTNPLVLPVEFYRVFWRSFANNTITSKSLACKASIIDASALGRIYRGPNKYVAQVVNEVLTSVQRRELSLAYKKLRHEFTQKPGVAAINTHLATSGNAATRKKLTVQMDLSSRSTWDSAITAHLDDLPFDCAGKGEQCRVQIRLAIADADKSRVILIEEPENHLSHSKLNMLMEDIRSNCETRQVIATTHSAFVLNKLGIDKLRLISRGGILTELGGLSPDTKDYFMRLPGYDTLRLILAEKTILVEGPSDELVVQRAYRDHYGKLPIENGVDVISVGLAFKRFLEIAKILALDVRVVTDNDGDVSKLKFKYRDYLNGETPKIKICYSEDEDLATLEPQLLHSNSLQKMNAILNKGFLSETDLLEHMMNSENKTECALRMFLTDEQWSAPEYIRHAIS